MTRTAALGAAFALLLSSTAIAQTGESSTAGDVLTPPPAVEQIAPSAEAPLMPGNPLSQDSMGDDEDMDAEEMTDGDEMMPDETMRSHMREGQDRRGSDALHGGPHGKHHTRAGRHHWRDHHGGGRRDQRAGERRDQRGGGNQGAVFRFSQGEGGPSFRIRCAARDTTQECAQAILPLMDRLIPQQQQPGLSQ